jgi:hypothetical protein
MKSRTMLKWLSFFLSDVFWNYIFVLISCLFLSFVHLWITAQIHNYMSELNKVKILLHSWELNPHFLLTGWTIWLSYRQICVASNHFLLCMLPSWRLRSKILHYLRVNLWLCSLIYYNKNFNSTIRLRLSGLWLFVEWIKFVGDIVFLY